MPFIKKKSAQPIAVVDYKNCPAKTFTQENGEKVPGCTVFNHCQIVGRVAEEIIRLMPSDLGSQLFPVGAEMAAASHDIGKVCPTFYNKIMRACSLPRISEANPDLEREWGGHAGVSELTARHIGAPKYVPEILGQHHGFSPNVTGMRAEDDKFGGKPWQQEREKLVTSLENALGKTWPKVESDAQARVLAGLTSVADWIGSGSYFENPHDPWEPKITNALYDAGFVSASYRKNLRFQEIFGFSPRQIQLMLIKQISGPGVYVLEAPMGLGKTEAALYSAYRMLEGGQARGIYFALPTQLTSNKIIDRFQSFLDKVLSEDCQHRALLLHADAWLLDTDIGEEGRPGYAWFNQSRRGLLAPFAVGTIDQALMAAMNVKHGFVRAFGLAGKVVVLDEVHTYDAYTGTLLDELVKLLRQLQCTVIILSATLNQERRQQLLGCRKAQSIDYPLITGILTKDETTVNEVSVPMGGGHLYRLSICQDESDAVEQALLRAEQGQQVLWIENTVRKAQQCYLNLAARATELGVDCGLLHSRFTVSDRKNIEEKWVNLYGKVGWERRLTQGRILVGTQVLEQSLDIDADFMVSRFAPTDMLLQRLGRLWRHRETPRCARTRPEAWLMAPDLENAIESPEESFGASAFVYSPYILCRSLEVWKDLDKICLPRDIRDLIERTYNSRDEKGIMRRWLHELDYGNRNKKGRIALKQLARVGLAAGGNTLTESKAQTRYSETDNYEVLMLRGIFQNSDIATLTLLNGKQVELPLKRNKLKKSEWRHLTATLMRQIVNVPPGESPKCVPVDKLKRYGLQHCFFLGNSDWPDDESLLRVALVDNTGRLQGIWNNEIHDKYLLDYREDIGYRAQK